MSTDVQKTKVLLLTILAAVTYGVIHDQVTAHLFVEYFSVAHPPLFHTDNPTLLAFCWGIAATIGIGAVLGMLLAGASQSGDSPPIPIPAVTRSLFIFLAVMACAAAFSGLIGFQLSQKGILTLPSPLSDAIDPTHHARFFAVWFAHIASYLVGLAGGAFLILRTWSRRGRPPIIAILPRTKWAWIRALLVAAIVAAILYFAHT